MEKVLLNIRPSRLSQASVTDLSLVRSLSSVVQTLSLLGNFKSISELLTHPCSAK